MKSNIFFCKVVVYSDIRFTLNVYLSIRTILYKCFSNDYTCYMFKKVFKAKFIKQWFQNLYELFKKHLWYENDSLFDTLSLKKKLLFLIIIKMIGQPWNQKENVNKEYPLAFFKIRISSNYRFFVIFRISFP